MTDITLSKITLIPRITQEELQRRYNSIRFVGEFYNEGESGPTHLRWLEKREQYANGNPGDVGFWMIGDGPEGAATDLELIGVFPTRHPVKGGDFDEFSPSMGEYLAQIPAEILEEVAAIEFENHSRENLVIDGDTHLVMTKFYRRK